VVVRDVAVVGAGTGNDVAAALRVGAKHVDAIEIDPAIMEIGRPTTPSGPTMTSASPASSTTPEPSSGARRTATT